MDFRLSTAVVVCQPPPFAEKPDGKNPSWQERSRRRYLLQPDSTGSQTSLGRKCRWAIRKKVQRHKDLSTSDITTYVYCRSVSVWIRLVFWLHAILCCSLNNISSGADFFFFSSLFSGLSTSIATETGSAERDDWGEQGEGALVIRRRPPPHPSHARAPASFTALKTLCSVLGNKWTVVCTETKTNILWNDGWLMLWELVLWFMHFYIAERSFK